MRWEYMALHIEKSGKGVKSTVAGVTVQRFEHTEAVLNALAAEGWELASAGYYGAGFTASPDSLILRRALPPR